MQKFLHTLVSKPPEVGHFVSCFHPAKSPPAADVNKTSTGSSGSAARKVTTFSAIENFEYQSWRDFSDLRLIDPSGLYPIIEIHIVLNFFPGDHFTADKYKSFVLQLTKEHSGKDVKITIDDYFHIEDHREWTFFIGNQKHISPWWDNGIARVFMSCVLLFGWPMRMGYHGEIAKHHVEVKKAVFCENTSQDEGVSLSATPGSGSNEANNEANAQAAAAAVTTAAANNNNSDDDDEDEKAAMAAAVAAANDSSQQTDSGIGNKIESAESAGGAATNGATKPAHLDIELRHNEQLVNAVVSNPPPMPPPSFVAATQGPPSPVQIRQPIQQQHHQNPHQQIQHQLQQQLAMQEQYQYQQPQHQHYQLRHSSSPPMPPQRSVPLTSPRTHLRETTKDIVTAVTHSDINGVSAVNTVALKDIDVQMTAISGYETYV